MTEKTLLPFVSEILAVLISLFLFGTQKDVANLEQDVFAGLAVLCVLSARLLADRLGRSRLAVCLTILCLAACFVFGVEELVPLAAVLLVDLTARLVESTAFLGISAVLLLLLWLYAPCPTHIQALCAALALPLLFARQIVTRLEQCRRLLAQRREETDFLRGRLSVSARLMKVQRMTARLQERNRLAARIHDKVGHGISGSILLLEAALLTMDSSPAAARATVEKAVENLRESVDDIRLSLRSERVERSEAGLGEIEQELARFSSLYHLEASLQKNGRLERVSGLVWGCILENLREALSNVLRHSNATRVVLKIEEANRVVRVAIRDNGRCPVDFERGIGLDAMEDRVTALGGRCFFEGGETGFSVLQIFPLV